METATGLKHHVEEIERLVDALKLVQEGKGFLPFDRYSYNDRTLRQIVQVAIQAKDVNYNVFKNKGGI